MIFFLKQGRVFIYIRDSCKLIFSFLDGALISWSPVGSGGLLKGQSLHKHTVSAISSRDDDSSLKSSRYMSPHVIFPNLWLFCCFGLGIEIHAMCDFVVFWNHNCETFYWKLKCRKYGNFVFALWAFFMHISPHPLRGGRGRNAATLWQAAWPCCFIILLTVALRVLKYWTEHEKWWLPSLPFPCCPFSKSRTPGRMRLCPDCLDWHLEP